MDDETKPAPQQEQLAVDSVTQSLPSNRPVEAANADTVNDSRQHRDTDFNDGSITRVEGAGRAFKSEPPVERSFGDYDLLKKLGEGGMGIVYLARQRRANRLVALKLIRSDRLRNLPQAAQQQVIARFQHEAQAAASLDHDHIVTVYDVGEVDGEHFFSMRLVDGESLKERLDDGPLENRDAAQYILQTTRAVAEAHAKGILHRDIKPQNILVDNKTNHPLVADFGLAKLLEDDSQLTRDGEVMGTPSYMSPEQAANTKEVTEQSDVYSLGATLYFLLTGNAVFRAATPLETLHQVLEHEPVAPRQFNPNIDPELETLVLKCLNKDPRQRYESASDLADELDRYMRGEPILARPITPMQRLWRWSRKHRAIAATSTAAVACLLIASIASTVAYVKTSAAHQHTETARQLSVAAHQRSEQSFRDAMGTVHTFLTRVSEETLLNQPGLQPLRQDLLKQARDYYSRFLSERSGDANLQDELAEAHFRTGLITADIESPDKALDSYDSSIAILDGLLAKKPNDSKYLVALSNSQNAKGQALFRLNRLDDALHMFQRTLVTRLKLVKGDDKLEHQRKLANARMNFGIILGRMEKVKKARQEIEGAQKIRQTLTGTGNADVTRDLAKGYFALAQLCEQERNFAQAQQYFEKAVGVLQNMPSDEMSIDDRYLLSTYLLGLAPLQKTDEQAATNLRQAMTLIAKLAHENPTLFKVLAMFSKVELELAAVEARLGNKELARELLTSAHEVLVRLAQDDPTGPDYFTNLRMVAQETARLNASEEDPHGMRSFGKLLDELMKTFPDASEFKEARGAVRQYLESVAPSPKSEKSS